MFGCVVLVSNVWLCCFGVQCFVVLFWCLMFGCVVLVSNAWTNKTNTKHASKHWTPKQHNKTAQPKADKDPTFHFSPLNCCFIVVL